MGSKSKVNAHSFQKSKIFTPKAGVFPAGDGSVNIQLGGSNDLPEESFYADYIFHKEVLGGHQLIALQIDSFSQLPLEAVVVVFDEKSFDTFVESFKDARASFLSQVAEKISFTMPKSLPIKTRVFKVIAARAAVSYNGISIDFYHCSPMSIWLVSQNEATHAKLKPIIRIETLAGRLNDIINSREW